MALAKINGATHFIPLADDVRITKVSNGRWKVQYEPGAHEFLVIGGKASGGASNEWFCHHPRFFGDKWVPCKSMVAAVKLGVAY